MSGAAYFKFLEYAEPVQNALLGCLPHSYLDPGKSACNFVSGCKTNIFKCKLDLKCELTFAWKLLGKESNLLRDVGFSIMFDRSFRQAEWQKAITYVCLGFFYREAAKLKLFP